MNGTLVGLFERQVAEKPQEVAIIADDHSLSYEELNRRANNFAYQLAVLKADSPVAICMPRSIDLLVVILAVLKAGGACVFLDPYNPEERLVTILNDDQLPMLVTSSAMADKFSGYQGRLFLFNTRLAAQSELPVIKPEQLAYIIYTSGSTGKPKGVLVEHGSIVNYIKWFADLCRLRKQERVDFSSNSAFDFALTVSIAPLVLGLTVVICEDKTKKDPALKAVTLTAIEKKLVAYYILHDEKSLSEGELRQYLKKYLPDYMIPGFFIAMESFPLNGNDKLNFKKFPQPSKAGLELPRNTSERILAKIWAVELGFDSIGINENFFELGGDSLSAARVISTITEQSAKKISITQFYQTPTISELARLIDQLPNLSTKISFPKQIYQNGFQLPLSNFQFTLWLARIFEPKATNLTICSRKRLQGYLDEARLNQAFKLILKKQDLLSYRVSTFVPAQQSQRDPKLNIVSKHLENLPWEDSEKIAERSFEELRTEHRWQKGYAPFKALVLYLPGGKTELQLAMPHILADEESLEIFFSDLSLLYEAEVQTIEKDKAYREYVFAEQEYMNTHLNHDLIFWHNYLQDVSLFAIPDRYIVSDKPYSNYNLISEQLLDSLTDFCAKRQLSLDTGLTGVLLLALGRLGEKPETSICINKVQSTRDNRKYDDTMGCFLNVELLKLSLGQNQDLNSICEQLGESAIKTSPYQKCSNLVKLASLSNFPQYGRIKERAINGLISLYNLIFSAAKLNKKIINHAARINRAKGNHYLINVNFNGNFFKKGKGDELLFGFASAPIKGRTYDLLAIDNVLDICFMRIEDKAYMVLSANLSAEFHELLKRRMLEIFASVK